ncbi:hypothetical protein ILYODFUR_032468 [Ilyodon furcidens]|uniref:Uncharacterized protein n=1 Tax=Ilyodon furcidens TaxID=33524 RepID=A0ABV0U0P3_9TELE
MTHQGSKKRWRRLDLVDLQSGSSYVPKSEHPTFRRAPNGTLILKASREAQGVGPQKGAMTKAGLYRTTRREGP